MTHTQPPSHPQLPTHGGAQGDEPESLAGALEAPPASLLQANPSCTSCSLHAGCSSPGIPGRPYRLIANPEAPVLCVVGMNPGAQEDRASTCWVGPAGTILTVAYLRPFLKTCSIYLLNTARCATPGGGRPTSVEYATCLPYTLSDLTSIASHHPHASHLCVLCCGADPAFHISKTFLPSPIRTMERAFSKQNIPLPALHPRAFLYSTYHPAYILRDPSKQVPVGFHLQNLLAIMSSSTPPSSEPTIVPPFFPPASR